MADFFGVFVLFGVNRVTAPAHHDLGVYAWAQGAGVAQKMEDVVGDAGRRTQVNACTFQTAFGVDNVAQGAEQHLSGTGDHFAVDKGIGRRIQQFKANATVLLVNPDFEVLVGFKNGFGVVDVSTGVEDSQYALAEQCVTAA